MKKSYAFVIGLLYTTLCFGQVWTGAMDNNWNNPQNWNPNGVPTNRIEISVTNNPPQISQEVPTIQSLTIKEGASLNIAVNGVLTIMNENTSIGLNNKGTIHNQGSILIEEASSFGISNDGTLTNDGIIESSNMGMHGVFNFKTLINNGQIKVNNSLQTGIENIGTFENSLAATIHIEASDSIGLKNYGPFNNDGTIDIFDSGLFALQNVHNFDNNGTISIQTTAKEGMTNHKTFNNFGTLSIEASSRAGFMNYSDVFNHGVWSISDAGLQGIMNYRNITNYGTINIQNSEKNGIENLTFFENRGTLDIAHSKNVGIFNAATFFNYDVLNIDESITAGLWTQVKFENHGEMTVSNTTWSGIANLGIFTNFQNLQITNTFNRGIENQSTFTNEKCAIIRMDDSIVNGQNSDIVNWGLIAISFEGDNWNQSNITNHGIIEDWNDSFGTQPLNNLGMIVRPIQICHNKTLGFAIQKGDAPNLLAAEIWYQNEEHTLSAGFYDSADNEYATVLPMGDHILYFDISDLQNDCTFAVQAKLNVAENPSIEVAAEHLNCFGDNSGSISIAASGGSNEYEFQWADENLTGSLLTDLPANDYEITVMDIKSNCSVTETIELTQPPIISTNFEQLQWASAPPLDKNKFSLDIEGGTAPYQFDLQTDREDAEVNLSETANDQLQIEASPFDPWSLEITDANGCFYKFDLGADGDDDINLPIIQTTVITNETDLGEGDGGIEITVEGGDTSCGDYLYAWSNGMFGDELDYLFAGGYEVVITDCEGNQTTAYIELGRDGEVGTNRKAMKVFPNPAVDWTKLRMVSENVDEVLVRLFDTNKQVVQTIYQGEVEGEVVYEIDLDVRGLPSGLYYIQLTTPSGIRISERLMTIK